MQVYSSRKTLFNKIKQLEQELSLTNTMRRTENQSPYRSGKSFKKLPEKNLEQSRSVCLVCQRLSTRCSKENKNFQRGNQSRPVQRRQVKSHDSKHIKQNSQLNSSIANKLKTSSYSVDKSRLAYSQPRLKLSDLNPIPQTDFKHQKRLKFLSPSTKSMKKIEEKRSPFTAAQSVYVKAETEGSMISSKIMNKIPEVDTSRALPPEELKNLLLIKFNLKCGKPTILKI